MSESPFKKTAEDAHKAFTTIPNTISGVPVSTQEPHQEEKKEKEKEKILIFFPQSAGLPVNDLGSTTDDEQFPSTYHLVYKLMNIDATSYNQKLNGVVQPGLIRIGLDWCKAQITEAHFIYNPKIHRSVLRDDSKVRKYGVESGLPEGLHKWLCGENIPHAFGNDREEYWLTVEQYENFKETWNDHVVVAED